MKGIVLALLIKTVKALITGPLYEHVSASVKAQMNTKLSKDQKRAAVKAELAGLKGDLGVAVRKAGENLINLAIEAAVAATKK